MKRALLFVLFAACRHGNAVIDAGSKSEDAIEKNDALLLVPR